MLISLGSPKENIERELSSFSKIKIVDLDKFIEIAQKHARKTYRDMLIKLDENANWENFSKQCIKIFGSFSQNFSIVSSYSEIDSLSKDFLMNMITENRFPESVMKEVEYKITKKKLEQIYVYKLVESLKYERSYKSLIEWNDHLWKIKDLYRKNKSATEIRNMANSGRVFDFSSIDTENLKKSTYRDIASVLSDYVLSMSIYRVESEFPEFISLISILMFNECKCSVEAIRRPLEKNLKAELKELFEIELHNKNAFPSLKLSINSYEEILSNLRKSLENKSSPSFEKTLTKGSLIFHYVKGTRYETEVKDLSNINFNDFIDNKLTLKIGDFKISKTFKELLEYVPSSWRNA